VQKTVRQVVQELTKQLAGIEDIYWRVPIDRTTLPGMTPENWNIPFHPVDLQTFDSPDPCHRKSIHVSQVLGINLR